MVQVSLKPTQKGVTALIVVAAVVFAVCLLACFGAMQKINSVDSEKIAVEKQVRESQTLAQTQRDSENKYLDTRAQIRCLESSVATQAYIPTLLKQIDAMGKSVNLKVLGVKPTPPDPNAKLAKKVAGDAAAQSGQAPAPAAAPAPGAAQPEAPKPYDEVKIDLQLEGSYTSALDFLYRLTSFPKIIAVNNIQMNPGSLTTLGQSPKLSIQINVTAFVFKEASKAKKPAAGTAQVQGRGANALAAAPHRPSVAPLRNGNAPHFQGRSPNEAG